jgi:type IV pilus assembly protein PilM
MASTRGVWGIDIGQCALKAMRCTMDEDGKNIAAEAFDYIEYPKILSQPEAEPDELIREALQTFLSRNSVKGDKIAISVSGQSGLARFIKLPPVESKKIPDIVKYEARQQIPFPLEEVIWDYQQLAGGSEEEGFTLETEVGLFAMKRDQVFKAIRPFDRADMELDVIQLAPLSIYNVVCHDFLVDLPPPDQYDPEDPPESVVVVSLGTDTTDLVVTNGYRVWQRNIPLGGNHFTRALTKDMKLTFAKAEHLKRNAREAEDPKKVFQAMRPVFNDLVTEVQRSISYFQSIDRRAKIGKVVALGNAMRLPGLQQYLSKNLGYDVLEVKNFPKLGGKAVTGAPAFKDNLLSFPVCYGLCLQGLGKGALSTNLLPRELIVQRMIREKKPWALATVAVLFLGLSFNFFFLNRAWRSVDVNRDEIKSALSQVQQVQSTDSTATSTDAELKTTSDYLRSLGDEVVDNSERRLLWPELLTAVSAALPYDRELDTPDKIWTFKERMLDERADLHITKIESQYFQDLAKWYTPELAKLRAEGQRSMTGEEPVEEEEVEEEAEEATADAAADAAADEETADAGPQGPGWVIELQGYHDFNVNGRNRGAQYVRDTLLKNLENMVVELPEGPGKNETRPFTLKELGITHPVLVDTFGPPKIVQEANPNYSPDVAAEGAGQVTTSEGRPPVAGGVKEDPDNPQTFEFERCFFRVQFAWEEGKTIGEGQFEANTVSNRIKRQEEAKQKADEAAGTDNRVAGGGI